jgi:hypothetical protein
MRGPNPVQAGRRIFALRGVRQLAADKQPKEILMAIDAAIAQDRKAIEIDAGRATSYATIRVTEKDLAVDRTLMAIEYLLSYHSGNQPDSAAAKLQSTLFPGGANFHTRLPHVEQVAANERVLAILEGAEHAQWLDGHGLRSLIVDLRRTHDAFEGALMARSLDGGVGWEQVKAARAAGQELYLEVVIRILAHSLTEPSVRETLMEPIWRQEELVRAYRRTRRGALADVDPESGELLDPTAGDGAAASDATPSSATPAGDPAA